MFYSKIISNSLEIMSVLFGIIVSLLCGLISSALIRVRILQIQANAANDKLKGIIECSTEYIAAIYNFVDDVEGLIKKADAALYEAKNTGKNKIIIYKSS